MSQFQLYSAVGIYNGHNEDRVEDYNDIIIIYSDKNIENSHEYYDDYNNDSGWCQSGSADWKEDKRVDNENEDTEENAEDESNNWRRWRAQLLQYRYRSGWKE